MEEIEKDSGRDMTPRLIGDLGLRKFTEKSQGYRFGKFECQYCSNTFESRMDSVKSGDTRSCGCINKGRLTTHGLGYHNFYKTWHGMLQRCTNPNHKAYKDYGARGITVCEEWLDVRNFIAWCELTFPNINNYSIDRIDNYGGYSPENCRWVDKYTQVINQRIKKNNTSGFVGVSYHNGKARWVASVGVNYKTLHIGTFKTIEEAVQARDQYILDNNLPNKLSTDYKREESQ